MTATFDINEDHDGDGMSTRDELLSGTEPLNAGSVLRITDFSVTGAASAGYLDEDPSRAFGYGE